MTINRPHSWRAVILPLGLLVALYLLARGIRSGGTADIVWPSLLVLALLLDLATGWRRRYWGDPIRRLSLMDETSNKWMAYIDTEVRAACEKKGWGSQIRRKWSVRDKPVSESSVDDYEWKLIPDAHGRLPEHEPCDLDEGTYYVLSLDRRARTFVLQHDTVHCGDLGRHFFQESFTEIRLGGLSLGDADYMRLLEQLGDSESKERVPVPPQTPGAQVHLQHGSLRDYLVDLTSRFKPNHFSMT